jgi:hypothetical protein
MSSTTSNSTAPENPLSNAPSSIEWNQTFELGYDEPDPRHPVCFSCAEQSSAEKKFSKCEKCHIAAYCSRDCQIKDWKEGRHKLACSSYARLASMTDETKAAIRNEIFLRIRFYACPYAVFKTAELGNGFLFVQSDTALKDLSIPIPKDSSGRTLTRSIIMHFLTMGEFDAEVCRDDFEMAEVRGKLQVLVNAYDPEKEVVVLVRLRCGHVALGKAVLVPDYGICKKLGNDYYANNTAGAVQLNLDDL